MRVHLLLTSALPEFALRSLVAHAEVMHIHVPPTRCWLSQETHIGSDCWPGYVAAEAPFQTYAKAPFQTFSRYFNALGGHLAFRHGGQTGRLVEPQWVGIQYMPEGGSGVATDRWSVWVSHLRWKQSIGLKKQSKVATKSVFLKASFSSLLK